LIQEFLKLHKEVDGNPRFPSSYGDKKVGKDATLSDAIHLYGGVEVSF